MSTFGPSFEESKDGTRIRRQIEVIRETMLEASARGEWLTLDEIHGLTNYPAPSVSADLRHLRKRAFGSYTVDKRRRKEAGLWEYLVTKPAVTPRQEVLEFAAHEAR